MHLSANRHLDIFIATIFSVALLACSAEASQGYKVPPSESSNLQTLLDEYGYIILEPNGDYLTNGPTQLTLSSGQKIEGGYGTRVPKIVIPAGVSNATIDSVISGSPPNNAIEFTGILPPGSTITDPTNYGITIIGGSYGIGSTPYVRVLSGAQVERLQATYIGGVDAVLDSGYIRNSVFRAVVARGRSDIDIKLHGNTSTPSYGNSIVRFQSISSRGAANVSTFGDLYLIGADAEAWYCYYSTSPKQQRGFIFSNMDALRMVHLSGGVPSSGCVDTPGAALEIDNTPAVSAWFDTPAGGAADEFDEYFDAVSTYVATQSNVDPNTTRSFVNKPTDFVQGEVLAQYSPPPPLGTFVNGTDVSLGITQAQQDSLLNAYLGSPKSTSPIKPAKRSVDLLGSRWDKDLASKPDSSGYIQAQIDANHIVTLPPGKYYLDAPLRIGNSSQYEGVIGSSKDEVFLISKGAFPVIQGRGDFATTSGIGIGVVLEGLSIYGGTYGLDFSSASGNLGSSGQIRWSTFKDLRFCRQSIAGVSFDHVYGADTNIWYRVDFSKIPIAFRGIGTGVGPGMNYADKQYFVDNQYHNISDAVWNWDSVRASGGNAWIDSYYFNVGEVSKTRSAYGLMWVNSVFNNVTGPIALHILDSGGSTATYYFTQLDCLWKGTGPAVVTDTFSGYTGTLFIDTEFNQNGGSIVAPSGTQTLLAWNSKITGSASVGNVTYGAFVNSLLGGFDKELTYIYNGVATDAVSAPAAPYRQVMAR